MTPMLEAEVAFKLDMLVWMLDVSDPYVSAASLRGSRSSLRLRWGVDPVLALTSEAQRRVLGKIERYWCERTV